MRKDECKIIVEILSSYIGRKDTFVKLMDAADEVDLYFNVNSEVIKLLYNYGMSLVGNYDVGSDMAAEIRAQSICESMSNQEKIDLLDEQLSERELRKLMLELVDSIYDREDREEMTLVCPNCGSELDEDNWCWSCGEIVEGKCEVESLENVIRKMVIDIYFECTKKNLIEKGTFRRSSEQMLRDMTEKHILENYGNAYNDLIRICSSIDISVEDEYSSDYQDEESDEDDDFDYYDEDDESDDCY